MAVALIDYFYGGPLSRAFDGAGASARGNKFLEIGGSGGTVGVGGQGRFRGQEYAHLATDNIWNGIIHASIYYRSSSFGIRIYDTSVQVGTMGPAWAIVTNSL